MLHAWSTLFNHQPLKTQEIVIKVPPESSRSLGESNIKCSQQGDKAAEHLNRSCLAEE
jgi:hypothetical protein